MRRVPFARARAAASAYDFMGTYVDDLPNVVDIHAIRAGLTFDSEVSFEGARTIGEAMGRIARAALADSEK